MTLTINALIASKKKRSPNLKPRPIISRFMSYKKRNEFMYSKSNLKGTTKFKETFVLEDLTPPRAKLFNYVKKECND